MKPADTLPKLLWRSLDNALSSTAPLLTVLALVFMLDADYQSQIRHLALWHGLHVAILDAFLYTAILWITIRLDLARMTVCFLALPYFIFIPGWLNPPTAVVLIVILIYSLLATLHNLPPTQISRITWRDVLAFLLILALVNLSGAGGYGFQWDDYGVNNARLHDLVVFKWPIRYGNNQNFVYYFGYFLPAAAIGKVSSVTAAIHSMYAWTVLGVTLALRWLAHLSRWRLSILLVFIFILFGPIDLLNFIYINHDSITSWHDIQSFLSNGNSNQLNFASGYKIGFFVGNYLSNVFNLYWSPQQIIAGWLCAGMTMHLFSSRNLKSIVFVYALLCLWAPLVMIAFFPMLLFVLVLQLSGKNRRNIISPENTVGAGSLAMVFVMFYLGGSSTANPSFWLFSYIDWPAYWDVWMIFYLAAWGIYALAVIPFIVNADVQSRIWFVFLVISLAILPFRIFGEWSDLLCRGSAPLMFLMLVFLLQAARHYWLGKNHLAVIVLLCLLISGAGSAVMINHTSIQYYGSTQPTRTLLSYHNAYPNLGPDNTWFEKLFRHKLPVHAQEAR